MTFARERDGQSRLKADLGGSEDEMSEKPARRKKRSETPEVGTALRSVYQRTVDEDIPADLLDLLGKLG